MSTHQNQHRDREGASRANANQAAEPRPSAHPADAALRYSVITGIFILPFIPLFVSNHLFFPFITGKNFTFRIIVEIVTALWLILALRDRAAFPKMSRIFYAFAAFIGLIFISDLLSPNIYKSFWSNYERMEGWVTLAHLFALFTVLCSVMTKKIWEWLFRVSMGVSLILFFYGCFQLAGSFQIHQGGTRIDATIGNSAYLGGYMLFHVFLALYFLFGYVKTRYGTRGGNLFWPIAYAVTFLADVFILFKTATRGAEIGFVAGLVCVAAGLVFFEKENKILRRIGAGILITIVALLGLLVLERKSDFVMQSESLSRLGSFADQLLSFDRKVICNGELKSRCLLWPMSFEGVKERPLLGWGQESFNYVFNKYYDPRMYSQEQWFDRTHNVFFDWLIAGGVLGLLSYLSLFYFALSYLWRKGSPFSFMEASILSGLLVAYFFHNLTVFDNITSYILFVFVLAWIGSSAGRVPLGVAERLASVDEGIKNRLIIPLVGVAAIFVLYTVNVPAMLASSELIAALSSQPGGPAANLLHFEKALSYRSMGDSEIHEQLVQTTNQGANTPNIDTKVKNDFFNLTRKEMLLQLERTPADARYFLFMGSFLTSFGDLDNAITYLKKAHELSPKKQTILFSLGFAYLSKKDYTNALATMKEAYDLEPSYSESQRIYGLTLIYARQADLAAKVLKPLPLEVILGDERFTVAFYTGGYFDNALQGVNFLLQKNPANPQYYFLRAAILNKMGRNTLAIADLNKAVEINPSFKGQIDGYIKDLKAGKDI